MRWLALTLLSVALPAAWFIALRTWLENLSGPLRLILVPESRAIFIWPVLLVVIAWALLVPKPRLSLINLVALGVAVAGGLFVGLLLGLELTCSVLKQCM